MRVFDEARIRRALRYPEIVDCMRDALLAQARSECETPPPLHLDIAPESAEVHIKAGYRRGGPYFALKVASSFPDNLARGLSTGNGMMLLFSGSTGEPAALLADGGHLTDVRTAAVAAMVARELGRRDASLGILGSGIQARLQAQLHAEVLPLEEIWIWGRTPDRAAACRADLRAALPGVRVEVVESPAAVAARAGYLVCCTASRAPLLTPSDLQSGSHIAAVGSDAPGKQELDPAILRQAALVLADSLQQCRRLGELQHSPEVDALEIGSFCQSPRPRDSGITVCDFTGLGVEDLFIAEYCLERMS